MAFSVTNTFTDATTIEAADLNENFDDIEAVLNGGLTTSNLSSSAGITNGQLATSLYEVILTMTVSGTEWDPAISGDPVAFVGFPADVNSEAYTILQADYVLWEGTDTISDGGFKIDWGYFNAGTWTQTTAILSTEKSLPSQSTTGKLTLDNSSFTTSTTNQNFFAIVVSTPGTTFSTADAKLTVTLKIKRNNGLRS